jgi:hypothetical protein
MSHSRERRRGIRSYKGKTGSEYLSTHVLPRKHRRGSSAQNTHWLHFGKGGSLILADTVKRVQLEKVLVPLCVLGKDEFQQENKEE